MNDPRLATFGVTQNAQLATRLVLVWSDLGILNITRNKFTRTFQGCVRKSPWTAQTLACNYFHSKSILIFYTTYCCSLQSSKPTKCQWIISTLLFVGETLTLFNTYQISLIILYEWMRKFFICLLEEFIQTWSWKLEMREVIFFTLFKDLLICFS